MSLQIERIAALSTEKTSHRRRVSHRIVPKAVVEHDEESFDPVRKREKFPAPCREFRRVVGISEFFRDGNRSLLPRHAVSSMKADYGPPIRSDMDLRRDRPAELWLVDYDIREISLPQAGFEP